MSSHAVLVAAGCVLLVIALVLHIICLAMPYYVHAENLGSSLSNKFDLGSYRAYYPDMDADYGFWKIFMKKYRETACYSFGLEEDVNSSTVQASDWLIACQALSLIGLALGVIGVVLPSIWMCISSVYLLVAGSIFAICGGIIIIIADIIFAAEKSLDFFFHADQVIDEFGNVKDKYITAADDRFDYEWGFGLDIATGIACVLIGVVFAVCAVLTKSGRLYISKGGAK